MENTNPSGEVAQDPVAAIAGILEREAGEAKQPEPAAEEAQKADETQTEDASNVTEDTPEGEAEDDGYDVVEYEGKEYELPKELKDAVLRQSDYTRKTQEVAEQRRLIEAQAENVKAQEIAFKAQQAFHQEAMQDMADIRAVENILGQYQGVDWNALSDQDPVQAQKLWFKYQQTQQHVAEMRGKLNQKYTEFTQAQQQAQQQAVQKGLESLKKDIPNWSPEKAQELRSIAQKTYGYTDAELANTTDPRFVKLVADAAAYRKLQQSRPDVNKRVQETGKTLKPGAQISNKARKQQGIDEARARLKKTGKTEDAAALIAKMF